MDKIKVVILEGGKTAKEVNPLGENFIYGPTGMSPHRYKIWIEARDKLRTFEIVDQCKRICSMECRVHPLECKKEEPSKIFEAEIISKHLIRIV